MWLLRQTQPRPLRQQNGRNTFSAGHGGSLQTPIKMMCQAMTSNCFNTHCNTLSSILNPDAPPFIPNPNPIHNKNDTASIGSTRGKFRRHGQHHNGQTNITDVRLKTSDSNDRGSRNNVNIGHLNINRILHKIHHIRQIISQKHRPFYTGNH